MADNGGKTIADVLEAEGVAKVFGIPDGTYLGLLNALVTNNIEVVTPRHETTAVHMAAAYARLRGELGVAIASNGPGVANALPGIAVENAQGNCERLLTLPVPLVRESLRLLRSLKLTQYGPEQVDFLRYRPVLDNRRPEEDLVYIPAKTSREAFDVFVEARNG